VQCSVEGVPSGVGESVGIPVGARVGESVASTSSLKEPLIVISSSG
jgi:hypothetical protein